MEINISVQAISYLVVLLAEHKERAEYMIKQLRYSKDNIEKQKIYAAIVDWTQEGIELFNQILRDNLDGVEK